ncbi:type I phosphomannose isomerase catalytic subunit [Xylanibacter ruminicola]|uniref:Mannose-6-phosphate isomerase n=1 Tax=Xylanibacter ruminicola TaxID=839 RepID=A0A1M6R882_XYLRU|nr:type I phosphomannose isomerase catalytic subunit [Xylanibacter ruminicola]SHK28636.1 mannose-6-phosphate isomerase [Xylanibacter ruminicola]
MIRHLADITPVTTSHGVGQKRVLLSSNESGCSLTQIAVTELKAGEIAAAHVHPDMQESFYVLDGELEVYLDGKKTICNRDTFVYVEKCTSHEMLALTNSRIMTIGCVIEASRNKLYPMLFKQNRKTLVWGTEDWTVSGVPNSESEVENGTWARYNLTEVISRRPEEILGRQTALKYNNQLPLLAKIIDAHQDLSIQVHPNDEMAKREHNKYGKSEMWYILDAEPGAYLYAGFKEQITPEQYKERVANGTITDVLAKHEVHKGDVFYLPSGRVHAICGGIKLAEIQQSSDVTYRIFDYNRPGLDGKPRELHTELAAKAIDYTVYPEYKTQHEENIGEANEVLNTPFFSIKIVETNEPFHRNMIKYDSFIIIMNIGEPFTIRVRATGDEVLVPAESSCLIPAAIADYELIPAHGSAKIMEAFINNKKSIGKTVKDFFHLFSN